MKYRSRADIIAALLNEAALKGELSKTHLMFGAYLSYTQITDYLEFLLAKQLLVCGADAKHYALTEKGKLFLQVYGEIRDIMSPNKPLGRWMPLSQ